MGSNPTLSAKTADGQFYRVLHHDTGGSEIRGIENVRLDISRSFTSAEAADWVFSAFELPLYQARYRVDQKCREILAAFCAEDEL